MTKEEHATARYPHTPDGRYFVVRGRLWRLSNPNLDDDIREGLVGELMAARRAVQQAKGDSESTKQARMRVNAAKTSLGERGRVWWSEDEPDFNRHMIKNTPYADWYKKLEI